MLACMVLAGCRIDTNISARITDDGIGLIDIVVEADEEFASNYALTGRDLDLEIRRRALDIPALTLVDSTDLSWQLRGVTRTPEELAELIENLSPSFEDVSIVLDDQNSFTADFNAFATGEEIAEVLRGVDPSEINADVQVVLALDLPGELISSNGDRTVNNKTVEWSLGMSDDRALLASTDPGASFPYWILLVVIVSLAGGWFLRGIFGYLEERTALASETPDLPKAA